MGVARVDVSGELLAAALHLPRGAEFAGLIGYDPATNVYAFLVRSPDFPTVTPGSGVATVTPLYRAGSLVSGVEFVRWGGLPDAAEVADEPVILKGG